MNPITKIRTLEPILFYSGKQDELQIFLNEAEYGELIIKSLSHDQIRVKAVMLGEAGENSTGNKITEDLGYRYQKHWYSAKKLRGGL
ncbi:hypothetical protein [Pedobacter kyonggii]|uniref:Uncharacterized protein n=1 Tax=Pedobacter kyonggii TaxID=1926871 RepID=A0A4V2JGS4_9SPHI|nr:hypothetical protein [Pedobacter kyonggii]TBO41780.1 hypothetical protein EYS08_13110 [Pedobacter kyonggii]